MLVHLRNLNIDIYWKPFDTPVPLLLEADWIHEHHISRSIMWFGPVN